MTDKPRDQYAFAVEQQDARELTQAIVEFMNQRGETMASALLSSVELTAMMIAQCAQSRDTAEQAAEAVGASLRAHLARMMR